MPSATASPAPLSRHQASRRRLLGAAGALALGAACRAGCAPAFREGAAAAPARPRLDAARLEDGAGARARLPRLQALLIAHHGEERFGEVLRGPALDEPVNVKSVSKSVIAALVGVAIGRGLLAGVEQRVAPLLADLVPADADPRIGAITLEHLLTMRAGLERTSGRNYGGWVIERELGRATRSPGRSSPSPAAACCTRPAAITCCPRC